MAQQAKLIDYLQTKVENPPKKKRGVSYCCVLCKVCSGLGERGQPCVDGSAAACCRCFLVTLSGHQVGSGGSCSSGLRHCCVLQMFVGGAERASGGQWRELQHSLEQERDKNARLQQQIIALKDELHQRYAETGTSPLALRRCWYVTTSATQMLVRHH